MADGETSQATGRVVGIPYATQGERGKSGAGKSQAAARAGGALCTVVASYFLMVAGFAIFNAEDYASDTPRIMRYVVGPLLIVGLLLVAGFLLSPGARLMTGLSSAAVMLALFAFEALLTARSIAGIQGLFGYLGQQEAAAPFHEAIPPSYTLKQLNRQMGVSEPSEVMLGGMPRKRVLLCTRGGEPVSYVADRYGFRNPDEVYDAAVGMLVLGDSFAEGLCLADGYDIAGQIRSFFPATVNTGTRGAGPLFELAILRRWGPRLRPPETVMLFFAGNDMENLEAELTLGYLRPFLEQDVVAGSIDLASNVEASAKRTIAEWWDDYDSGQRFYSRRPWLRNFLGLHQTAAVLGLHYPEAPPDLAASYEQILDAARVVVNEWNGRLTVVYIPQVDRFTGLLPNGVAFDGLRDRVREAAADADVRFVDLTVPMSAAPSPSGLYAPDAHLSEAGARLAAEAIHRVICVAGSPCAAVD